MEILKRIVDTDTIAGNAPWLAETLEQAVHHVIAPVYNLLSRVKLNAFLHMAHNLVHEKNDGSAVFLGKVEGPERCTSTTTMGISASTA